MDVGIGHISGLTPTPLSHRPNTVVESLDMDAQTSERVISALLDQVDDLKAAPPAPAQEGKKIDGKAIAATIRDEIKEQVAQLKTEKGVTPGLAVVIVGNRPDSATYVRMKKKAAAEVDFHSVDVELEESVTQEELLEHVEKLNTDPNVHGILVQLPLPKHIDEATVLKKILVRVFKEILRQSLKIRLTYALVDAPVGEQRCRRIFCNEYR